MITLVNSNVTHTTKIDGRNETFGGAQLAYCALLAHHKFMMAADTNKYTDSELFVVTKLALTHLLMAMNETEGSRHRPGPGKKAVFTPSNRK